MSRFKAHNLQYENRLHFVGADAACAYRPPLLAFYQTTGCCAASAAQRYILRRVLSPRGEKEILSCAERQVSKILHNEKLFLIMVGPATGGYPFQIGHIGTSISWQIIRQAMSLFQIIDRIEQNNRLSHRYDTNVTVMVIVATFGTVNGQIKCHHEHLCTCLLSRHLKLWCTLLRL